MNELLRPILVSGGGRSGTTLLMQLLGTSDRIAFDRVPPFEHRYLTFLMRTALLAAPGAERPPGWDQTALTRLAEPMVGPIPFPGALVDGETPLWRDLFLASWGAFTTRARTVLPAASHYAEKTPPWMAERLQGLLQPVELIPIRDPRDVLASVVAFVAKRGRDGFGMRADEDASQFVTRFVPNQRGRLEAAARAMTSGQGIVVRYEDMALAPEATAQSLGERLGVSLDAAAVIASRDEFRKHMTSDSVESSVGRWRRDLAPEVAAAFAELGPLMAKVGYEP